MFAYVTVYTDNKLSLSVVFMTIQFETYFKDGGSKIVDKKSKWRHQYKRRFLQFASVFTKNRYLGTNNL